MLGDFEILILRQINISSVSSFLDFVVLKLLSLKNSKIFF